jgi:hypothetical protein
MAYTDSELQRDITAELKWEPSLRDDDIAVGVRDGIVKKEKLNFKNLKKRMEWYKGSQKK